MSSIGMLLMQPFMARLAVWADGWHLTGLATGLAAAIGLVLSLAVVRRT